MLMLLSVSQKMNDKVEVPHVRTQPSSSSSELSTLLVLGGSKRSKHRVASKTLVGFSVTVFAQDRERVMPLMIQGFRDAAEEGGTSVTGGQTVVNPWIIIGGVATVVCQPNEFIM